MVVELKSKKLLRYTRADPGGKFIFDGLDDGDYDISVFPPRYPQDVKQLGFTKQFHTEEKSCANEIVVVPKN